MTEKDAPVAVQLETCHANRDGSAWYAYYPSDRVGREPDFGEVGLILLSRADGAPVGLEPCEPVLVPSALSVAAGMRRYHVGNAT